MLAAALSMWYCQASIQAISLTIFSDLGQLRAQLAFVVAQRIYLALN